MQEQLGFREGFCCRTCAVLAASAARRDRGRDAGSPGAPRPPPPPPPDPYPRPPARERGAASQERGRGRLAPRAGAAPAGPSPGRPGAGRAGRARDPLGLPPGGLGTPRGDTQLACPGGKAPRGLPSCVRRPPTGVREPAALCGCRTALVGFQRRPGFSPPFCAPFGKQSSSFFFFFKEKNTLEGQGATERTACNNVSP